MTVKELIEILQKFPQDLTVICDRYSDYVEVQPEEITIVKAVTKVSGKDGWIMRAYDYRFDPKNKNERYYQEPEEFKEFVHFVGN